MSDYEDAWKAATSGKAGSSDFDEAWKASALPRGRATLEQASQSAPIDFANTFKVATPFGTIDTGLNSPEWLNRRLAQYGSGVDAFGMGVRQLLASDKPTTKSLITGKTEADSVRAQVDAKKAMDNGLNDDVFGKLLSGAGQASPMMALPIGYLRAAGAAAPVIEGAIAGGLSGFLNPVGTGDSRGMNTALGTALGGAVPAAWAGVKAAVRPVGEALDSARQAVARGIPISSSDIGPNWLKSVRSVMNDLPIVGSVGNAQDAAKQAAFNKAVGGELGVDAASLTPDVMAGAKKGIASKLDAIWSNNNLQVSPGFYQKLQALKAEADTLPAGEGKRLLNWIGDVESKMTPDKNGALFIPGDTANNLQSSLGREVSGKATGYLKDNLDQLRKAIIGEFNASVGPQDAAALAAARGQYKAFKTVEGAMNSAELGIAGRTPGDVPASLLANAVRKSYGDVATNGASSGLPELAKLGSRFMVDRVPRTGGSTRALVQNAGIGAGMVGGVAANPIAGSATIGGASLLNGLLGSPAVARSILSKEPQGLLAAEFSRLPIATQAALQGLLASPAP